MSCPETKTRTTNGGIATTHSCDNTDMAGKPIDDFTKLAGGTSFYATPKWISGCGEKGLAGGKFYEEFRMLGKIPPDDGKSRLASGAPELAEDATFIERASFLTCGGSRDVFTARSRSDLTTMISAMPAGEVRAVVAWATPADLVVLGMVERVREIAGDVLDARRATHPEEMVKPDPKIAAACGHVRHRVGSLVDRAGRAGSQIEDVLGTAGRVQPEAEPAELLGRSVQVIQAAKELGERLQLAIEDAERMWLGQHDAGGMELVLQERLDALEHHRPSRGMQAKIADRIRYDVIDPLWQNLHAAKDATDELYGAARRLNSTAQHAGVVRSADARAELYGAALELRAKLGAFEKVRGSTLKARSSAVQDAVLEHFLPAL